LAHTKTDSSAGLVVIFMQKSLSPLVVAAVHVVVDVKSGAGTAAERLMSTLTAVVPFLMGKDKALKVSEPLPSGNWHVFEALASPLQESLIIPALISRSKFAPATSSSRSPVPVMVVFVPVVIEAGVKLVIFV